MADDTDWYMKKVRGIFADPKDIRSMSPGESWIHPRVPADTRSASFVHEAESVRPRGIPLHAREEPDVSDTYARGGAINTGSYDGGGFVYGSHTIPIKIKEMEPGDEWRNNTAMDAGGAKHIINDTIKIKYPRFSGDTLHQREEPDVSDTYARGGAIDTGVPHYDTGGSTMQPFGYDPSSYVTNVGNWANKFWDNQNQTYNMGLDQFNSNKQTADAISATALANSGIFDDAAKAGVSRYQTMYAPAMQQYLQKAQNWASPENLAYYRGQAISGVNDAFAGQARASSDSLKSYGLDPKAVASRLDSTIRTQQAAAEAGAGTQSDNTRLMQEMGLLGTAIGQGQADAGVTQGFAGAGINQRNQAINAKLATEASRQSGMGSPQGWGTMAGAELKEWPKAQLDAMHASNEQGALWNDINRTNLVAQQQNYNQGSGFGAIAGGLLGAASNMFSFSPMTLGGGGTAGGGIPGGGTQVAHGGVIPEPVQHNADGGLLQLARGGVIPSFAGGGSSGGSAGTPMTETWRKFVSGNIIGAPDPIGGGESGQNDFVHALKDAKGSGGGKGKSPFRFNIGGGGDEVTPSGPQGSGPGGEYQPGDLGGAGYEPYAAGNNPAGIDGPVYARGGLADLGMAYAGAGAIQTGPVVPPSAAVPGIKGPDTVPAMVQPGEGILPLRVMRHIGQKGLQAIIDKVDRDTGNGPQPKAKGVSKPMPQQAMQTGPTFASYGAMA